MSKRIPHSQAFASVLIYPVIRRHISFIRRTERVGAPAYSYSLPYKSLIAWAVPTHSLYLLILLEVNPFLQGILVVRERDWARAYVASLESSTSAQLYHIHV
jgi:hypothetical protein